MHMMVGIHIESIGMCQSVVSYLCLYPLFGHSLLDNAPNYLDGCVIQKYMLHSVSFSV